MTPIARPVHDSTLAASGFICLVMFVSPPGGVSAGEPDFYLRMSDCRMTVGYMLLSDESLKTFEGAAVTNACTRRGKKITCRLAFDDGAVGLSGNKAEYRVAIDSPPHLHLTDDVGAEWIAIHTVNHSVVIVTRVLDEQFVGSKVCHGIFLTQTEMEGVAEQLKPEGESTK